MVINFTSFNNADEEHVMHLNSDNIEIMINDKTDEVIEKLFQSILSRYQIWLETSVKCSVFDYVYLSYYICRFC